MNYQSLFDQKWKFFEENFIRILENEDNSSICFQEIYETVNDLILLTIPKSKVQRIEKIIFDFASKVSENLSTINKESLQLNEFLNKFNCFWGKIKKNFILLRKILKKYEHYNVTKNLSNWDTWTLCIFIFFT